MLTMRDATTHQASPTAERNFRRLKQLDIAVFSLVGIMAILAIWNVATLIGMFGSGAPDLADISRMDDHPSRWLIYLVGAIALALFVFKEWKFGERTPGMWYLLLPLLALLLTPTVSAELQPNARDKVVEFTLTRCPMEAMDGNTLADSDACTVASMEFGDVFLADADPASGDFDLIEPVSVSQAGARWTVAGVGTYKVYFLVVQESLEQCTASTFTSNVGEEDQFASSCIERNGVVYSVHPFATNYMTNGWLVVYQATP